MIPTPVIQRSHSPNEGAYVREEANEEIIERTIGQVLQELIEELEHLNMQFTVQSERVRNLLGRVEVLEERVQNLAARMEERPPARGGLYASEALLAMCRMTPAQNCSGCTLYFP